MKSYFTTGPTEEVGRYLSIPVDDPLIPIWPKDHCKGRELFLNDTAIATGVVYLQHEVLLLELPNGRTWKVFGSPVWLQFLLETI
jgi:hypothetical protein